MKGFMKIAIAGPAGSGKDTIAHELQRKYKVQPLAFATPIKEAAAASLGISVEAIEEIKSTGEIPSDALDALPWDILAMTPEERKARMRRILQMFGTELFRDNWSRNTWVQNLRNRVATVERSYPLQGKGVAVTDMRFRNEFMALKDDGYFLVRVDCPERYQRCETPPEWARNVYDILPRFVQTRMQKRWPWFHPSERDLDPYRNEFDLVVNNNRIKGLEEIAFEIHHAYNEKQNVN